MMTTTNDEKPIVIEVKDIPKRPRGRPTLQQDRGIDPEAVLSTYWTLRSARRTAKAMQISVTSVKKYLELAGGPDRSMVRYKQPYPWFRKGAGPVWAWIAEHKELIEGIRDLGKLSEMSNISEESLKKALTRRKGTAYSYLLTHGRIQDTTKNLKLMDLEGKWRPVKYIEHYELHIDRYSLGVRMKMIFANGTVCTSLMTYPEALELFQIATGKTIPLPQVSVLVKTVKADFPILNESTLVLPAAAAK